MDIENKAPSSGRKPSRGMMRVLRSKAFVAAVVVVCLMVAVLLIFPVYRITDDSMYPTLKEGDIVLTLPLKYSNGRVVVIRYGTVYAARRIIAQDGQMVDMDENGTVYIDTVMYDEPYLEEKALGNWDIGRPYRVPEKMFFLLGDNRADCIDSRSAVLGSVGDGIIEGCAVLRIYPLKDFGLIY